MPRPFQNPQPPAPVIPGLENIQAALDRVGKAIEDSNRIMLGLLEVISNQADHETGGPWGNRVFERINTTFTGRTFKAKPKVKPQRRKFDENR